jgi:tight adherence protein B
MRLVLRLGLAALAAAVLAGAASSASAPPRIVEAGGVSLPERAYILSLPYAKSISQRNVKVTENGGPVNDLTLSREGKGARKTAVVIAIDESLTMKGKPIQNALDAAKQFAQGANPDQQIAIVTFNGNVNTQRPLSSSPQDIVNSLNNKPEIAYGTKNYDALADSLKMIQDSGAPSGSVIILTDGQNVGSVAKPAQVLAALKAAHVRVFAVGLQSPAYEAGPLEQMANVTGGDYVKANTPEALKPLLASIGRQLAREFLLQYKTRQNPGKTVNVAVKVAGVPGVATSQYQTPKLVIKPAPPYNPPLVDRVVQSRWTMLLVAAIIAALVGWAVHSATRKRSDALVDRVSNFVAVPAAGSAAAEALPEQAAPKGGFLSRISASTSKSSWSERMAETLELADIKAEPIQVVILTLAGTIFVMVVLYLLGGPLICLIGLVTPFLVRAWILNKVSRKRRAFAEQLPDNLDVLASALRAGHSLVGALSVVADDAIEPSKSEFQRVLQEEQFGVNLEDAFQVAVKRMNNMDLDQVALVARLQREVGSNSAEVLDRVIETVRGRMELRRLVRVLTAQGRLSRWILTALPVGLALILTILGHDYMKPLYHETLGQVLMVVAALMVITGSWMIGKIVDIRI